MRKNSKIFGLIACSAMLAGAVVAGASNLNVAPVAAEETPVTFEVVQSAQVKYGTDGGIRFAAKISKDYLDSLGGTKIELVSSIDKKGNTDADEARKKTWDVTSTFVGNATNTYYHAISFEKVTDQLKAAAAVDLTATMWLEKDGVKVEGSEQSVTRSMRAVANAVYDKVSADNQTELNKYLGTRTKAKNAFKELADDEAWVVDGGAIATSVYKGATPVGTDLAVGEKDNGSYALFDADNNVYNVSSVTYVTKTLATQTDMRNAILGTAANQVIGEGEYYAVVANLGEGGTAHSTTFYRNPAYNVTFNGVFDGNGHTVTTTLRAQNNMFSNLGANAVIKNLGVYAVNSQQTLNNTGTHAWALLGKTAAAGSKVENCYIKVDAKLVAGKTVAHTNPFVRMSLVGNGECSFENVIFEVLNSRDTSIAAGVDLRDGIISTSSDATAKATDYNSMLNNVYLVSSTLKEVMAFGSLTAVPGTDDDLGGTYYSSNAVRYYAANDTDLMNADRYGANGEDDTVITSVEKDGKEVKFVTAYGDDYIGKQVQCTSTYRYDTGADMATAGKTTVGNWVVAADGTIVWSNAVCTEHDYEVVDSKEASCTEDGYVKEVCQNCGNEKTTTIQGEHQVEDGKCTVCGQMQETTDYATVVNFSTADGTLPLADIFGSDDVTIIAAYQGGTKLTVEENVISGLQISTTEITETTITLYSEDAGYKVPVKVATKWITTAAEMLAAVKGAADTDVMGTGCVYALANNICEGGTKYSNTYYPNAINSTFNGVFDGNGHTVTMTTRRYGAFGSLGANAVIKNLKLDIVNQQFVGSTTGTYYNEMLGHIASEGAKIENVYVKVNATFKETTAVEANPLRRCTLIYGGVVDMENVIFEILNPMVDDNVDMRDGIITIDSVNDSTDRDYSGMLNNVYLVSSALKYVVAFGSTTSKSASDDLVGTYYTCNGVRGYAANDGALKDADRYGANGVDDVIKGEAANGNTVVVECGDDFLGRQIVCENAYRYDTASAMANAGKTTVGNWVVAADGTISWVNSGN